MWIQPYSGSQPKRSQSRPVTPQLLKVPLRLVGALTWVAWLVTLAPVTLSTPPATISLSWLIRLWLVFRIMAPPLLMRAGSLCVITARCVVCA
ncbi:hypothetical protein D9M68_776510 [compost metagenome]